MSVITRFNRALPASIQAQLLSEYGDIGRKALAELDALLRTAGFIPPSNSDEHEDAAVRQRIGRLLRLLRIAKAQKLSLNMHTRAQLARGMLALALATPELEPEPEPEPGPGPEPLPLWQRTRLLAAVCDLISSRWMGGTLCMELLAHTEVGDAPRPQVTWRDMRRALYHHFLRRAPSTRPCGQHILGMHLHMLLRAAKAARRGWGGAEAAEMADAMLPCLRQTHSTAAFEAQATLCLLMPRPDFRDVASIDDITSWGERVHCWFALWEQIDRCAEWDCGWLRLLGRIAMAELRAGVAGKAVDWAQHLPYITGRVRQLLHLPSVSGDRGVPARAWPRASAAVMCVRASGPEKGARILVLLLGMRFSPTTDDKPCAVVNNILQLLTQARTLLHPAAARGAWTGPLSRFVSSLCYQLAKRVGAATTVASSYPGWTLRAVDAMALREALLPLVLDGLYAQHRNVQESSQQALAALASLAPVAVTAKLLPRALNALAITNLEQVHQAPAILRVLQALVVPLLRGSSTLSVLDDSGDGGTQQSGPLLAPWLPSLLPLTLQGIDPNDTYKTVLTLHLCFTLLQWLPLIDCSSGDETDCEGARPHFVAIAGLEAEDGTQDMFRAAFQAGPALEEWSLQLLDRLLKLTDAMAPSGVMGSNGDADSDAEDSNGHHAGGTENWVRAGANGALACLFSQMSPSLHRRATERVRTFIFEECRPETTKSAAAIIAALVATSVANSDDTAAPRAQCVLLPPLLDTLLSAAPGGGWQLSPALDKRTLCSKLRLLDGFIRGSCGTGIALSSDAKSSSEPSLFTALRAALRGALAHKDKRVRAVGCKLLRHALQRLLHTYPIEARSAAPSTWREYCSAPSGEWPYHAWGAATTWENLGVSWHVAGCDESESTDETVRAAELLDEFLVGSGAHVGTGDGASEMQAPMRMLQDLVRTSDTAAAATATDKATDHATKERWLQALRQLQHVLRGVLVALPMVGSDKTDVFSRLVSPLRAKIADLLSSVLRKLLRQGEEGRGCATDSESRDGASLPLWITRPVSLALQCAELVLCDHGRRGFRSLQRQWGFLYAKQLIKKDNLVAWASTAPLYAELGRATAQLRDVLADAPAEDAAWGTYNGLGTPLHPRLMLVCRAAHQRERLLAQREWNEPRRLRRLAMQRDCSSTEGNASSDIYDSDDDDGVEVDAVMDHETDADVMVSSPTARVDWSARLASYERLVEVIAASASASQYDAVRSESLASISRVLCSWGWLRARLMWRQLRVLSTVVTEGQDAPSADALMAAAELLRNGNSLKWIASRPEAARKLTMALCNSDQLLRSLPAHRQQSAQSTLFQIFAGWGMEWSPCVPQPVTQHNARPEHPTAPLLALVELLEGSIGGDKDGPKLHWRYVVTATAWLLLHQTESLTTSAGTCQPLLPHCTLPTDLQRRLWRWFARCAFGTDDTGTSEKLCMSGQGSESSGTSTFLPLQQVGLTGLEVLSEQTLQVEQALANKHNHPGQIGAAPSPPRDLYAWLQTELVAKALLSASTANHLAQAEDSAGADASQVRGAGISAFFARQSGSMWSTNVSQAMSVLRLRTGASFPSSRHGMPKSNVAFRHVAVVERLTLLAAFSEHAMNSLISSAQLDAWVTVISDALEMSQGSEDGAVAVQSASLTEQERMARRTAAAECFAGVLSACICSDAAVGANPAVATSRLLPIMVHGVTSSTLNDVNDWVVSLRIAVSGYSIEHPPTQYGCQCIATLCAAIEEHVQASLAMPHGGGTAPVEAFASQLKWLRVFKALLMETECRVPPDGDFTAVHEACETQDIIDEAAAALARGGRAQGRCGSAATWRSIMNAAAHPYSVCRQELAQCLALGINGCPIVDGTATTCIRAATLVARAVILDTASPEQRALGAVPRSARHVLRLHRAQAYAQTESAESLDDSSQFIAKDVSEAVARRTETAMYLCLQTIGTCDRYHFGVADGASFVKVLLPTMLSGHAHPVPEVELVAKAATTTCAQSLKLPEWSLRSSECNVVGDLRQIMQRSGTIAQVSCSWRVRLAALRFTVALALRNAHILLPKLERSEDAVDRVARAVDGAISDVKASYTLSASVRRQTVANETAAPLENCTEWGGDEDARAPAVLESGCLLRWVLTLCFSALSDAQAEVCEEARLSLSGFCMGFMQSAIHRTSATDDDEVDDAAEADGVVQSSPALRIYVERFVTLAQEGGSAKTRRKLKRLQAAVESAADDVAKAAASKKLDNNIAKAKWKETTGVLALAAVVTAFPHHLPLVLPAALAQLASHGSSRNPVARECAKQTTSKFKASHSENWTALKRFFSTDQLESLEGELFALSYFA